MTRAGLLAFAVVLFAIGVASCGGSDTESVEATVTEAAGDVTEAAGSIAEDVAGGVEVALSEQNGSGESGTATLSVNDDGSLHVVLALTGGAADVEQPAHIHAGTCAELDPQPAFPLANVLNGSSETDVQVTVDELAAGSYAINVHKSEAEAETYVACGDITDISP